MVLRSIAETLAGDAEVDELLALSVDLIAIAGVVAEGGALLRAIDASLIDFWEVQLSQPKAPDARLWRIDRKADYGPFNSLSKGTTNLALIRERACRNSSCNRQQFSF